MFDYYPRARLCPLCDSEFFERRFRKNDYWICRCSDCGHWFAHLRRDRTSVAKIYDGQYFQGDGVGYVDYFSHQQRLRQKGEFYAQMLAKEFWPGTCLDVGAAAGFFLAGLKRCGWQGEGLEPNQRIAQYGRKHLQLKIHHGTLEDFENDTLYDFVFMVQVVPHFYDLKRALQKAADVTRPGGFWLIETWDRKSWSARLQGKRWRAYQPPAEQQWFCANSLTELIHQYGFTLVKQGRVKISLTRPQLQQHLRYTWQGWMGHTLAFLLGIVPRKLVIPWTIRDRMWLLFEQKSEVGRPNTTSQQSTAQSSASDPFLGLDWATRLPFAFAAWAAQLTTPPDPARVPPSPTD